MSMASDITELINAVRELCGVGICYYDLNDFFNYETYGIKNNRGHYCEFCERARALPAGRASCEASDRRQAVELARQYREPFFFECHMGMRELVIPLMREGDLLGIIFVGQCRLDDCYTPVIRSNARRAGGDGEEFAALYDRLPIIGRKDLYNVGKILSRYFDAKILSTNLLLSEGDGDDQSADLPTAMQIYIRKNYRDRISAGSVAEFFHIHPSYASRIFSQKHGVTMTDYINGVRIEEAKLLLRNTDVPIGNVALNVGFDDPNYFTRIFRKTAGCSPCRFRTSEKSDT